MPRQRALVIGGSIAGLLAAHALRRAGWDAVVYERAEHDLRSRGAGLGTHQELVAILERLGLAVDRTVGVDVETRICLDRSGRITHRIPMPQRMSAWGRVYRLLKDALPASQYRYGMELARVDQDGRRVTALFEDGTREQGDLLVGADGVRSTVRRQLWPDVEPRYAGYVAWRGLVDEAAFPQAIHDEIFEYYAFCLPPREMMLSYPVPGRNNETAPGRRGYNHIWYRPVDAEHGLRDLCTDASGTCHGTAIPPPLIRPELIEAMRADARELLAPQISRLVEITEHPFFQAIFDLESMHTVEGRIALVGDAAFVARPHVGMGVTKGALDVECLADALVSSDTVESALRRYQAQQRPFGSALVAQARRMGASLEAGTADGRDHDPEAVMRYMGSPLVDLERLRAGTS
ncbi:MAG TPA: FAD binding domain-containing protein [Burkholderiales bacterium]|nr:FAD binding domain-containing protein [Burkholderiales bacterium]